MWGILLQQELNSVCEDFGLQKMRLMEHYHPDRHGEFSNYADQMEKEMRSTIQQHGAEP